jgi:hypothetical protein
MYRKGHYNPPNPNQSGCRRQQFHTDKPRHSDEKKQERYEKIFLSSPAHAHAEKKQRESLKRKGTV